MHCDGKRVRLGPVTARSGIRQRSCAIRPIPRWTGRLSSSAPLKTAESSGAVGRVSGFEATFSERPSMRDSMVARSDRDALMAASRRRISAVPNMVAKTLRSVLRSDARMDGAARALCHRLTHPCDLDLLMYFSCHPLALLTRKDLSRAVGYDARQIKASVDALVAAKLLQGSSSTGRPRAELYRFTPGIWTNVLPGLLQLASSADGRHQLFQALKS